VIGDISELWLWANVYETDVAKVKPGYTARVTSLAYPDSVFTGIIDKSNQSLDPVSKVMKVLIRIPNKGLMLKPEMFANVIVQNKEGRRALQVPESAVVTDLGKSYVVQYFDSCHLEVREVQTIKTVNRMTYLQSGIDPGTLVVSGNQVLLYRALIDNK
jgi:cobalt-zinc-cadmium efflux system membrane fusion protein